MLKLRRFLHDCAKELPIEDYHKYKIQIQKIKNFDFFLQNAKDVVHSFASREFAKVEFGIKNKHILKAIASHTIGNKDMSLLDKIVFVADFLEIERKVEGIEKIREIAFENLDEAVVLSLELKIKFLLNRKKYICLDTVAVWNNLILERRNEKNL